MKGTTLRSLRIALLAIVCGMVAGCEDPQVYGSIGVSSYGGGGYYGSPRVGGSISVGGRIY